MKNDQMAYRVPGLGMLAAGLIGLTKRRKRGKHEK